MSSPDPSSPNSTDSPDSPSSSSSPVSQTGGTWQAVGEAVRDLFTKAWGEAIHRRGRAWPPPWLYYGFIAVIIALVVLVVIPLGVWIARTASGAAGSAAEDGISWLAGWELAQIGPDAVHTWIGANADAAGVEASVVWWCWSAAAITFFILSFFGVRAARIGWIGIGVSAVAATYAGPGGLLAAAIVVGVWCLVSIPALHRFTPQPVLTRHWDPQGKEAASRYTKEEACDVLDALAAALDDIAPESPRATTIRYLRSRLLNPTLHPPLRADYASDNRYYQAIALVRDGDLHRLRREQ